MGCPPARLLRRVARERPPPRPSLSCSGSAGPSSGLGHRTWRHRLAVSKAVAQRFARSMQNARWHSLPTGVGSFPRMGDDRQERRVRCPSQPSRGTYAQRSSRAPPCVTKDGQPLGAGGQAALPPHLGRPPTLPRPGDPGAAGNPVRAIRGRPAARHVFLGTPDACNPGDDVVGAGGVLGERTPSRLLIARATLATLPTSVCLERRGDRGC